MLQIKLENEADFLLSFLCGFLCVLELPSPKWLTLTTVLGSKLDDRGLLPFPAYLDLACPS